MLAMNVVTVKEKTARGGKIRGGKMRGGKMCEEKMCGGKRKWNCVSIYGMIGIAIGMSCAARVLYVISNLQTRLHKKHGKQGEAA